MFFSLKLRISISSEEHAAIPEHVALTVCHSSLSQDLFASLLCKELAERDLLLALAGQRPEALAHMLTFPYSSFASPLFCHPVTYDSSSGS